MSSGNRRNIIVFLIWGIVFGAGSVVLCLYSTGMLQSYDRIAVAIYVCCGLFIAYSVSRVERLHCLRPDLPAFFTALFMSALLVVSMVFEFLMMTGRLGVFSLFDAFGQQPIFYLVVFCGHTLFFYLLYTSIHTVFTRCQRKERARPSYWEKEFILFAVLYAAVLIVLYIPVFPYISSPDAANQWQQLHGELSYNRIHAIGHTVFLKLLLFVFDDFTSVIIFHIIAISCIYALFSCYFLKKGFTFRLIAFVFCAALVVTTRVSEAYFTPWKDTPEALCLAVVLWFILRQLDAHEISDLSAAECIGLGMALAGCYLFRLNGIIALIVCGTYFTVSFLRKRCFSSLIAMLGAIFLTISSVNLYAEKVLKPVDMENGFSIQVFGSGIAAMVNSGELSEAELADVNALLSVDWMLETYKHPISKHLLIWLNDYSPEINENPDMEIFNNRFVLALGENKQEVIALYMKLMPRHFISCVKDVLGSIHIMWRTGPLFLCSYSFPVLLVLYIARKAKLSLRQYVVFLPSLCNTVSIMISTITNEIRYLLPTFMLLPVYFLYILMKNRDVQDQTGKMKSNDNRKNQFIEAKVVL